MPRDAKVLCFIPMRNCQSKIGQVLARFSGELLNHISEILVIDNASTDDSVQEARQALAKISGVKVTLLQNSRNFGLGGSHKIAFNYAFENEHDYLYVVHGDNSADPSAFLPLLERRVTQYDVVLSDRLSGSFARKGYPGHRLFFNRVLSILASILKYQRIPDFGGGPLNIYRVSSFLNRYENAVKNFSNSIDFCQFAFLYALFRRMRIEFVAIDFTESGSKPTGKLLSQFLKPLALIMKSMISPRRVLAPDLKGGYFGHTFLNVKIDPSSPITPPSPKPRKTTTTEHQLLDLKKISSVSNQGSIKLADVGACEAVVIKMKLMPWHLEGNLLENQIKQITQTLSPDRIILYVNADEVVKSKQCYDFLTHCLDLGIEPQLITSGPGDINLWRNYSKLVKNLTITYVPGAIQRSYFFELCKEIAPLGTLCVNVVTDRKHYYHAFGLKKELEALGTCRSVLLQPYALDVSEQMPEDHISALLDQTAVVDVWSKNNIVRKHSVFSLGETLKDQIKYDSALTFGFMEMGHKGISKDKVKVYRLAESEKEEALLF